MRSLKPIAQAVRRKWYFVKFTYEYMARVPKYDAALDDTIMVDVRTGPIEAIVRQLAKNESDAYGLVQKAAATVVRMVQNGEAEERIPIEGTVVILGVEEQEMRQAKKEMSWL